MQGEGFPLNPRLDAAMMPFGPPVDTPQGPVQIEAVDSFGEYEAEYAAVRRHVGVLHMPWRTVLPLTGGDVRDFLHRLLTQDINGMTGGQTRRALQLDERGHVLADSWVHFGDAGTWIELDAFDAGALRDRLDAVLFAEDVTLGELTDDDGHHVWQCFALLGPAAVALLDALRTGRDTDEQAGHPPLTEPGVTQVVRLQVPGHGDAVPVSVTRRDTAGVLELRVWCKTTHATDVYAALLDAAGYEAAQDKALEDDPAAYAQRRRASLRGRPVGWSAYNTARLEAGTPLYHVDFGPDSLPAEAGVVDAAISFTKGCYPGQEAVARMKNLGHPKKTLVGLKLPGDAIPAAGTQVLEPADDRTDEKVIGAVTSSAVSPLWGQRGVALAMMRWGRHEPGTQVTVVADGQRTPAEVIGQAGFPASAG